MSDLYLSDELVRNIEVCRDDNMYQVYKEFVADGLCGIESAIDEVEPRTKKLLQAAKNAITTFHYFVDLMSEEKPQINTR